MGTPEQIKKDLVEEYLILDAEDRKVLRSELKRYGYKFSEDKYFTVHLDGMNVQKVIQSINTPLTVLKTHLPSLEEAYLEIIENSNVNA